MVLYFGGGGFSKIEYALIFKQGSAINEYDEY